ncbi:MAG TPA: glucosaminidase domain-containing protein [Acidobacteriaceae bacterium]
MIITPQDSFLRQASAAARAAGHIFPDYAACEAALESTWGQSRLAREANNLFGQKQSLDDAAGIGTLSMPTQEFLHGRWLTITAHWARFADQAACFRARMALLRRLEHSYPAYARALSASTGEAFIEEVSRAWSTDPQRPEGARHPSPAQRQLPAAHPAVAHQPPDGRIDAGVTPIPGNVAVGMGLNAAYMPAAELSRELMRLRVSLICFAASFGKIRLVSIVTLGLGICDVSNSPLACKREKKGSELSLRYCSREGLSMRCFSSSSGHTNSTNSTVPPCLVIVSIVRSMKLGCTVFSGLKVKIRPGNGVRQA